MPLDCLRKVTTISDHKSCTCLVLGERHLAVGRQSCRTKREYPEDSCGRCDWYRKGGGGMRAHSKQVKELGASRVVQALPLHTHQSQNSKVQCRPGFTDHVVLRLGRTVHQKVSIHYCNLLTTPYAQCRSSNNSSSAIHRVCQSLLVACHCSL